MRNKQKLKTVKGSKIFTMYDLTHEDRRIRIKLRKISSQKRQKKVKVNVGYKYHIVDEQKLKWPHATQILEKVEKGGHRHSKNKTGTKGCK